MDNTKIEGNDKEKKKNHKFDASINVCDAVVGVAIVRAKTI